jgi:hypothetical protein
VSPTTGRDNRNPCRAVAFVAQQCQCGLLGLDSLGDELQAERLGQCDDRPHDREIAGIGAEVADETPCRS